MREYYVYCRHIKSGREDLCCIKDSWKEAIAATALRYNSDKNSGQLGEYYYFVKER